MNAITAFFPRWQFIYIFSGVERTEPACQLRSGVAAMASSSEAAAADYDALSAEEQRGLF